MRWSVLSAVELAPDVVVYVPDVQVPDGCKLPAELMVEPETAAPCPTCGGVGGHLEGCKGPEVEVPTVTINRASGYDEVAAWCRSFDGAEMCIDRNRPTMVLRFDGPPPVEFRKALKAAGFTWNRKLKVWHHKCWGDVPTVREKILSELAEKNGDAPPAPVDSIDTRGGAEKYTAPSHWPAQKPQSGPPLVDPPAGSEGPPVWAYSDAEAEDTQVLETSDYNSGAEWLRSGGW